MLHRLLHFNVKIAGKKDVEALRLLLNFDDHVVRTDREEKGGQFIHNGCNLFSGKQHSFLPFLGNPLLLLQMLFALFKGLNDRHDDQRKDACGKSVVVQVESSVQNARVEHHG